MRKSAFFSVSLLLLVLLVSCTKLYRLPREATLSQSAWPFQRGDIAATGFHEAAEFTGRLNLLWEANTSGKAVGPPVVYNGSLVIPDSKRKIRFYRAEDGRYLGRVKTKGVAQSGPVFSDSMACFGLSPKRNRIYAYNLVSGEVDWSRHLKDAVSGPIIVSNHLIVGSAEGKLCCLDLMDGTSKWEFESEGRFTAPVSFGEGVLFQPADHGFMHVVLAEDGDEMYVVELNEPITGTVAVGDGSFYFADIHGSVQARRVEDGSEIWSVDLDSPVWTSPVISGDRLIVANSGGDIVAMDIAFGQELWVYKGREVLRASPLATGKFVLAGSMGGLLVVLDANDGSLMDSTRLKGAIEFGPITDGNHVFVTTQKGRIACFGDN